MGPYPLPTETLMSSVSISIQSPLELTHLRASSVHRVISDDEAIRTDAILENLTSYHGVRHVSSSRVDMAEYREWSQKNPEIREDLLNLRRDIDTYEREDSSQCPSSIKRKIYQDIGTQGELATLSILEAELRKKDPTAVVKSDQSDRYCVVPDTLIRIRGHLDALILKTGANGKRATVGIVEVKTRIRDYRTVPEDRIQLAIYSRMLPRISYYMLVERIHGKDEIKKTSFTYDELTETWNDVVVGLKRNYVYITTLWTQRISGTDLPLIYREKLLILIRHLIAIIRAVESQGGNPAPHLATLLGVAVETLNTMPITTTNKDEDSLRDAYDKFCSLITPMVKLRVRQRDLNFFRDNLGTLIGDLPEESSSYVKDYTESVATMISKDITATTRNKIWAEVDVIMELA